MCIKKNGTRGAKTGGENSKHLCPAASPFDSKMMYRETRRSVYRPITLSDHQTKVLQQNSSFLCPQVVSVMIEGFVAVQFDTKKSIAQLLKGISPPARRWGDTISSPHFFCPSFVKSGCHYTFKLRFFVFDITFRWSRDGWMCCRANITAS